MRARRAVGANFVFVANASSLSAGSLRPATISASAMASTAVRSQFVAVGLASSNASSVGMRAAPPLLTSVFHAGPASSFPLPSFLTDLIVASARTVSSSAGAAPR